MHWVTSKTHPIDINAGSVPLIGFPSGCLYRSRAIHALESAGRSWHMAYTSSGLAGIQAAVAAGLGLSILSEIAIQAGHRVLTAKDGFAPIDKTEVALMASPDASPATLRLADRDTHPFIGPGMVLALGAGEAAPSDDSLLGVEQPPVGEPETGGGLAEGQPPEIERDTRPPKDRPHHHRHAGHRAQQQGNRSHAGGASSDSRPGWWVRVHVVLPGPQVRDNRPIIPASPTACAPRHAGTTACR